MKHSALVLLFLAAWSSLAWADQFTRSFEVGEKPELTLQNISGDISIRSGSQGEIIIKVTRQDEDIDVDFQQVGDRISVETHYPRGYRSHDGGVSFEVSFPQNGRLEVESVSGDIELDGVSGDVELSSVSGDVEVMGASGNLELTSVSGSVRCEDMGPAELDATSISGSVRYRGGLQGGDYQFSSTSGSVVISHGPEAAYHIRGNTVSGSIKNLVGDEIEVKKEKYGPMKRLVGSVNGNGVNVDVDTVSGSITIERL